MTKITLTLDMTKISYLIQDEKLIIFYDDKIIRIPVSEVDITYYEDKIKELEEQVEDWKNSYY